MIDAWHIVGSGGVQGVVRNLFDVQPSGAERVLGSIRRHPWRTAAALALIVVFLAGLAGVI